MSTKNGFIGYLPNDHPPFGRVLLLGLQHVVTMFPATVLEGLYVGFHSSTVLFASGLATLVALLLSRWGVGKFIPLYYGSSFSYITAILAITKVTTDNRQMNSSVAQAGIIATVFLILLWVLLYTFWRKTDRPNRRQSLLVRLHV